MVDGCTFEPFQHESKVFKVRRSRLASGKGSSDRNSASSKIEERKDSNLQQQKSPPSVIYYESNKIVGHHTQDRAKIRDEIKKLKHYDTFET